MENKRFQIFVSSTYEDLKAERSKVFDSIMKLGHIPAGMEDFPAFDDDQLEYIKTIINDSDYYVLIIAGRYGSLSEDGLSFTEKEYDYAVSSGKTVLAFLHGNADDLPVRKTDNDSEKLKRLNVFRDKVKKAGRNVKFWEDQGSLALLVSQSLTYAFRTKPGAGWVRGNVAASVEILSEINDLRKENAALKAQIDALESVKTPIIEDIAGLHEITSVKVSFKSLHDPDRTATYNFTWEELFKIIGPVFMAPKSADAISKSIVTFLRDAGRAQYAQFTSVISDDVNKIKIQMMSYRFIDVFEFGVDEEKIKVELLKLTDLGKNELVKLRTIRSNASPAASA